MTSDVATRRREELHDGLASMTPAELRDATRRALLTVYSPQQAAIWLNVHASGDPVEVACKALRLCGIDPVDSTSTARGTEDSAPRRRPVSDAVDRMARSLATDRPGTEPAEPRTPRSGTEQDPTRVLRDTEASRDLEVQRAVTAAVRALLGCRRAGEVRTVLLEAVARLGGQVVAADQATELAIPLDLSLGMGPPLLPTPDPRRPETAEPLRIHLPELLEDARRVIERLEHDRELASVVERDQLTGLLSHRAYERLAGRVSVGDVLVLLDLDGFEDVEDVHGRIAGDQILRLFGAMLSEQMRVSEHALRLEDDAFLLVLGDPDDGAAAHVIERLRIVWERRRPLSVEFSAGVATVGEHIDRALEEAGRQLHQAKRDGSIDT